MSPTTKTDVRKPVTRVPFKRQQDGDSDQEQEDRKPTVNGKSKASVEQKVPLDSGKKADNKKVETGDSKKSTNMKKTETVKKSAKSPKSDDEDDENDGELSKKKTKKQEDPAELRRRFMNTFPEIHANARSKYVFVVAGKPKSFLQIGGMRAQFGKRSDLVYSLKLNTAGTIEDIDEMLANQVIHEYLIKEGIIDEDGDEDEIRSTLITADNYESRKKDKDFEEFEYAKNNTRDALERLLDQYLAPVQERPIKQTQQDKIKSCFEEYRAKNRVFDVTNWNDENKVGYKTVGRPSNRSRKHIATTLPIIANDPQKIASFVLYLGYDTETARREAGLDSKGRNTRSDA